MYVVSRLLHCSMQSHSVSHLVRVVEVEVEGDKWRGVAPIKQDVGVLL